MIKGNFKNNYYLILFLCNAIFYSSEKGHSYRSCILLLYVRKTLNTCYTKNYNVIFSQMKDYITLLVLMRRQRRAQLRENRINRRRLRDASNPFESVTEENFQSLFRLGKNLASHIIDAIAGTIVVRRNDEIPLHLTVSLDSSRKKI